VDLRNLNIHVSGFQGTHELMNSHIETKIKQHLLLFECHINRTRDSVT
jgi:hypothetical protein